MNNTAWLFRLSVGVLILAGGLILVFSTHGRHRPPHDDAALPTIVGPAPQTPAR